jgi:GTP cyclohydrolase II
MKIKQIADINFPTHWAGFRLLGFEARHSENEGKEERLESALALVLGDVQSSPPLVRIHSQ